MINAKGLIKSTNADKRSNDRGDFRGNRKHISFSGFEQTLEKETN